MSALSTSNGLDARKWGVLLVLCGAIFLEGIDVAMLNVALPHDPRRPRTLHR